MKAIKRALLFSSFFLIPFILSSQVAVKSNIVSDALSIPNIGIEYGINDKTTIELSTYYNPWKYKELKQYKLFMVIPEYKYWLCSKYNGHYFSAQLMGGVYNVMGVKPPFGLWSDMKDKRYKGSFIGIGLNYGYQYIISKNWNIEASVGVGYAHVNYRKYPCVRCSQYQEKSSKGYLGPTKAALNLIYIF